MGMTYVTVHMMKKEKFDTGIAKQKTESITGTKADDQCYIEQQGFISIIPPAIEMGNFEDTALKLSEALEVPVLVTMVFDSDMVVLQVYQNGIKEIEHVKSYDDNEEMDFETFIKILNLDCKSSDLEEVLSDDEVFAEEILERLGNLLHMDFLIMNDDY